MCKKRNNNKANNQRDEFENDTEQNHKQKQCKDEISQQTTEDTREAKFNQINVGVKEAGNHKLKSEY